VPRAVLVLVLVLVLALVLAPAARPALAAGDDLFTARDYIGIALPEGLCFSPDGSRVAFSFTHADFDQNQNWGSIAVLDAGGAGGPVVPARGPSLNHAPRFSPDGKHIVFLATTAAGDAAEGEAETLDQIAVLPVGGSADDLRVLTEEPAGVDAFAIARDGTVFYLCDERLPDEELERRAEREAAGFDAIVVGEDRPRREIRAIALAVGGDDDGDEGQDGADGSRRVYLGDPGIDALDVSPDGRRLVFSTNSTGNEWDDAAFDLYILPLGPGGKPERREALRLTSRPGPESTPRFDPKGRRVAFTAPIDPALDFSRWDVFAVDAEAALAGREAKVENLTGRDDLHIVDFAWDPAGSTDIFATVERGVDQPLVRFRPDGAGETGDVVAGPGQVGAFAISPDGRRVAFVRQDARAAPEVFVAEVARGKASARPLTALNAQASDRRLGAVEVKKWRARDGLEIEGLYVHPARPPAGGAGGAGGAKPGLILALHGGPSGRSERALYDEYGAQVFAARGYAVLLPNFRGSSGYGDAFGKANRGDLGGKDLEDCLLGVDHVVKEGLVDPERIAVVGGSYGGYLAQMIVAKSSRFKAAVTLYGVFNWFSDFGVTTRPHFERDYFDGYYWDRLELYLERSPLRHVQGIRTPILILHGADDDNVPVGQSRELFTALRELGRPCRLVIYPREGHGIFEPGHQLDAFARTFEWLDRHCPATGPVPVSPPVGPAPVPVPGGAAPPGRR